MSRARIRERETRKMWIQVQHVDVDEGNAQEVVDDKNDVKEEIAIQWGLSEDIKTMLQQN